MNLNHAKVFLHGFCFLLRMCDNIVSFSLGSLSSLSWILCLFFSIPGAVTFLPRMLFLFQQAISVFGYGRQLCLLMTQTQVQFFHAKLGPY